MRVLLLLALAAPFAVSAPNLGSDSGWALWSPRDEIAPRAWVDGERSRTGDDGSLALSGRGLAAVFGDWRRTVPVESGQWRRLEAYYRANGLDQERQQALARVAWRTADGKRAGREEYAYRLEPAGEWTRVTLDVPVPPDAAEAEIQLRLAYAPDATVWWDDVSFEPIADPGPRPVRIVSVNLRPRRTGSREASVQAFMELARERATAEADLIVLPEGVTLVGTGKAYAEVAEPVPGPTTETLAELAREKSAYVVAGLLEREGPAVYNTAVLLDRQGKLVGKYRKVYLPREEMDGGVTPGSDYPVFTTDFGRLGLMICWDVQYADPARALALGGAEIVAMPIWGGNETLAAARAIENHVFLVSSGYDHPTYVMDPTGERLAQAPAEPGVAEAVIDLNRRYEWEWLGEMRGRFFHELRRDVDVE